MGAALRLMQAIETRTSTAIPSGPDEHSSDATAGFVCCSRSTLLITLFITLGDCIANVAHYLS